MDFLPIKQQRFILKSFHFWIIVAMCVFLVFLYLRWPWREWQVSDGFWAFIPNVSSMYDIAFFEARHRVFGSLFVFPMIYTIWVFRLQGALIIAALSFAGIIPLAVTESWGLTGQWLVNVSLILLPLFTALIVKAEYESRKLNRRIAHEREMERQLYLSKVLEAQEKERQRIARELHDETIQTMVAIAKRAEDVLSSGDEYEGIEWIKDSTYLAIDDLRKISLDLRPNILDDLGLVPALRWLVNRMSQESNITINFEIDGLEHILTPNEEITILRVIQEALNNIKSHSQASEATVKLHFGAESVRIEINDNGVGFLVPPKFATFASKGSLGLIGMQERIKSLGGTIEIVSNPGQGTSIFAELAIA